MRHKGLLRDPMLSHPLAGVLSALQDDASPLTVLRMHTGLHPGCEPWAHATTLEVVANHLSRFDLSARLKAARLGCGAWLL